MRVLEVGSLFKFGRLASRSTFSIITGLFPREPRGPWREAKATVLQITRFDEFVVRKPHSRTPFPWPYQIVRFSFTPAGREQAIETLDNIESASLPGLKENTEVTIIWPADDPRAARLAGAQPGRPWANWFYVFSEQLLIAAGILALVSLPGFIKKRRRSVISLALTAGGEGIE